MIPKSILFPVYNGQRYYKNHYTYFKNLTIVAGVRIVETRDLFEDSVRFEIRMKNKRILIDFSDHPQWAENIDQFDACFKYHYFHKWHHAIPNLFPFCPISFLNWKEYYQIRNQVNYMGMSDRILNNQEPRHAATERRNYVQSMLRKEFGDLVDIEITSQHAFWTKIEHCRIAVFVPGARPNMIDRGHIQYLAFGCPTISPHIPEVFPWNKWLVAGSQYIQCADDYSDLIELIRAYSKDADELVRIGLRARSFFRLYCEPKMLWTWIMERMK